LIFYKKYVIIYIENKKRGKSQMKQVNVSLTILMTYFPEDLGLDDDVSPKELQMAAEKDVENEIKKIHDATNLSVNDVEIEVL
jgi:hypothetical protein